MCGDAELIATCVKDRCSEQVMPLAGRILLGYCYFYVLSVQRLRLPRLDAVVVIIHAVKSLFICHLYRRTVGDGEAVRLCFAQVYRLAGLTLREECGITLGGSLDDLVSGWEQVCLVFAGQRIGFDNDAFVLVMHFRFPNLILQSISREVVRVTNDIRDIVSLQFENELDMITEVITTQSLSER